MAERNKIFDQNIMHHRSHTLILNESKQVINLTIYGLIEKKKLHIKEKKILGYQQLARHKGQ